MLQIRAPELQQSCNSNAQPKVLSAFRVGDQPGPYDECCVRGKPADMVDDASIVKSKAGSRWQLARSIAPSGGGGVVEQACGH